MPRKSLILAALAILLPVAVVARAQESGPYQVLKIKLVGGDGGFDYVTADSESRNLYVARSGPDGHIGVFNLDTLTQVEIFPAPARTERRWTRRRGTASPLQTR